MRHKTTNEHEYTRIPGLVRRTTGALLGRLETSHFIRVHSCSFVVQLRFQMVERTQGLILRTRPLTETSLIIHWLTPDFGRIATFAKGARRSNSPFRGKLDLFYLADFNFSRNRRSELHTLREVVLRETHSALREELAWLQHASYCATLVEQTTETETPLPAIFPLLTGLLGYLPKQPPQPQTIFVFELVSHCGASPASLEIVALVFESCAIDVSESMEGKIEHATGIVHAVYVGSLVVVFETGEAMLPARWSGNGQLRAG